MARRQVRLKRSREESSEVLSLNVPRVTRLAPQYQSAPDVPGGAAGSAVESELLNAAKVFTKSSQPIATMNSGYQITMVNDAFVQNTGYDKHEILGKHLSTLRCDYHDECFHESIRRSIDAMGKWQGEVRILRRDGETYTAWETIDAVRDERGSLTNFVLVLSDIAPIQQAQKHWEYLAHHDPLTGLPNRLLFQARLEQSIEHAKRHVCRMALFFLDIDDFKGINDTFGHAAGDHFLKSVADRLQAQVRAEDTVARLCGDEFAIVLEEITDTRYVHALAAKLNGAIGESVEIEGCQVSACASMGIGLFPDDAKTPENLLKVADKNMYRAKPVVQRVRGQDRSLRRKRSQ